MYKSDKWKVVNIHKCANNGYCQVLNTEEILTLKCGKYFIKDLSKIKNKIKEIHFPDLLLEKNNEKNMIIEVKGEGFNFQKGFKQKRTLEELGKMGYGIKIYIV